MLQERVLKEKLTLKTIVYCDERQMSFVIFTKNFKLILIVLLTVVKININLKQISFVNFDHEFNVHG